VQLPPGAFISTGSRRRHPAKVVWSDTAGIERAARRSGSRHTLAGTSTVSIARSETRACPPRVRRRGPGRKGGVADPEPQLAPPDEATAVRRPVRHAKGIAGPDRTAAAAAKPIHAPEPPPVPPTEHARRRAELDALQLLEHHGEDDAVVGPKAPEPVARRPPLR